MIEYVKLNPCSYQARVRKWMHACFGEVITRNRRERAHRFLEEALELVQTQECTKEDAHALVDYVYGRAIGHAPQEVGGCMITLAALADAADINMRAAAKMELARVWTIIDRIRAKQAAKRDLFGPLP